MKLKGLKTRQEVRAALRDEIERILLPAQKPMNLEAAKPLVIMMAGVNGAGKTTTIGKIAKWLAAQNKTVLLAAADTFRAAAREQLAVWGERNKIDVITQSGGDPAAVVFDAVSAGRARNTDVVIADTAGRLPTQTNLMEELARIRRSQGKAMEGAPTVPTARTHWRKSKPSINTPVSPALSSPNLTVPPKAAYWWPSLPSARPHCRFTSSA